jgi:uncharacterized protein YigE (DUF2233 family)
VVWKDDAGKQLPDLPAARAYLDGKGEKTLMLMNGGIFEPNGIFLISDKGARVIETGKWPLGGEFLLGKA